MVAVELKTVEEAIALNQRAHHGGVPTSTYNMVAMHKMCWAMKEAQKNAAAGKPPTPVEEWLLRNWRVPAGVEKSADRVARQYQGQLTRGAGTPSSGMGPPAGSGWGTAPFATSSQAVEAGWGTALVPTFIRSAPGPKECIVLGPQMLPQDMWFAFVGENGEVPPFGPGSDSGPVVELRHGIEDIRTGEITVLGIDKETETPRSLARKVAAWRSILACGPKRARMQRPFFAMAIALLVSKGAYAEAIKGRVLPLRRTRSWITKVTPTVAQVIEAFADCGVSVEEMALWDDFVLAWAREYVRKGNSPPEDDIQRALVDRENPPVPPRKYAILECVGPHAHPCRVRVGERTGDERRTGAPGGEEEEEEEEPYPLNPLGLPIGGLSITNPEGAKPSKKKKKAAKRAAKPEKLGMMVEGYDEFDDYVDDDDDDDGDKTPHDYSM
jgi:hypothetical protein